MASEGDTVILLIVAWLFPPAAAAFVSGCGADLCINILLTMLGYLPGCLHAFWLVLRRAEANNRYGYKNWSYAGMGEYRPAYGAGTQPAPAGQPQPQPQPPPPPPPPPPAGPYPPPPGQAPVDQKPEYTAPPPPTESKSGNQAVDQKSASPAPAADQKSSGVEAPPQGPAEQKQADTTAQSTTPASSS